MPGLADKSIAFQLLYMGSSSSISYLQCFVDKELSNSFPESEVVLCLFNTLPIGISSTQRSLGVLRRIKNYCVVWRSKSAPLTQFRYQQSEKWHSSFTLVASLNNLPLQGLQTLRTDNSTATKVFCYKTASNLLQWCFVTLNQCIILHGTWSIAYTSLLIQHYRPMEYTKREDLGFNQGPPDLWLRGPFTLNPLHLVTQPAASKHYHTTLHNN